MNAAVERNAERRCKELRVPAAQRRARGDRPSPRPQPPSSGAGADERQQRGLPITD